MVSFIIGNSILYFARLQKVQTHACTFCEWLGNFRFSFSFWKFPVVKITGCVTNAGVLGGRNSKRLCFGTEPVHQTCNLDLKVKNNFERCRGLLLLFFYWVESTPPRLDERIPVTTPKVFIHSSHLRKPLSLEKDKGKIPGQCRLLVRFPPSF